MNSPQPLTSRPPLIKEGLSGQWLGCSEWQLFKEPVARFSCEDFHLSLQQSLGCAEWHLFKEHAAQVLCEDFHLSLTLRSHSISNVRSLRCACLAGRLARDDETTRNNFITNLSNKDWWSNLTEIRIELYCFMGFLPYPGKQASQGARLGNDSCDAQKPLS